MDLQPVKSLSQTEKKLEKHRANGQTAKIGKGGLKVIKRNLIQSSEQVSREPAATTTQTAPESWGPLEQQT